MKYKLKRMLFVGGILTILCVLLYLLMNFLGATMNAPVYFGICAMIIITRVIEAAV